MWLSDFRMVLPDRVIERGSLRIEAGRIAELSEIPVAGGAPGDGMLLLPGFVDIHGDMIEQEIEPRPRVDMPMALALRSLDTRLAAAGVTTAYAAVSFSAGASNNASRSFEHTSRIIRELHAAKPLLRVDHKVHARFDITFSHALQVMEALIADGTVDLISLMDHTPGQGQYRDIERHVRNVADTRGVHVSEAERLVQKKIRDRTRPAEILSETLNRISALCREKGVAMASHDDDTLAKVALMDGLGVKISEFPVTEEAARAAHSRGLATAMGAPNALRGGSYSGNLSARAAHAAGILDILAADYHPGAILPALLVLAKSDSNGVPGAVRLATLNPANALGLTDRGAISPGRRADLVIADDTGVGKTLASLRAGEAIFTDGTVAFQERRASVQAA